MTNAYEINHMRVSYINSRDTSYFDSENDYRTGYRNVSCCEQQSYSRLHSPGRSYAASLCDDMSLLLLLFKIRDQECRHWLFKHISNIAYSLTWQHCSIYANLWEQKQFFTWEESNSQRICLELQYGHRFIVLEHQYGPRFIVLEHQYGRRDVMWIRSIWLQASCDGCQDNSSGNRVEHPDPLPPFFAV